MQMRRRLGRVLLVSLLLPAASVAQELNARGGVTLVARIPEMLTLQAQMAPLPRQAQAEFAKENLLGSAVVLGGRFLFANGQSYSVHASLHRVSPHPTADLSMRIEAASAGMLLEIPVSEMAGPGAPGDALPAGMTSGFLPVAATPRVRLFALPKRSQVSGLLVLMPADSRAGDSSPRAELRITATAL